MLDSLLPNGNDCWYVVLQNQNKLIFLKPFLDTNDVNIEIHSRYVLSYESKVWSIGNNVVELNGSKYHVEMIWSRNDSQHHRMHLMIKIVDPNIHDHQDHQQPMHWSMQWGKHCKVKAAFLRRGGGWVVDSPYSTLLPQWTTLLLSSRNVSVAAAVVF